MAARMRKLVVAALVHEGQRILLTRRRHDQSMPDFWELPGGKIEEGEAPAAALEREIREELDVACRVGVIAEVIFHRYAEFDLLMLVYHCTLASAPRPVEVAEINWALPSELARYQLLPADAGYLLKLSN